MVFGLSRKSETVLMSAAMFIDTKYAVSIASVYECARRQVANEAGSRRRVSVAGSHVRAGESGFLPISAGKASNK